MASLPPQSTRPSTNRAGSSSPTSPTETRPLNRQTSSSKSVTSEDPQTLLSNKPPPPPASSKPPEAQIAQSDPSSLPSDSYPRKCWICFADETEDTPTSSAWRSPCPCALTAHESCLLDWVADLEAPSRKHTGMVRKIQCPQCKADITIARPRSYVVEGVQAVDRVAGKLILPGIVITLAGALFTLSWVSGVTTIYIVFGQDDFIRLMGLNSGHGISARMGLGLPLIPWVLVLSRTTLADSILPVLPILLFATQLPDGGIVQLDYMRPSAAMSFAALPYLRGAYNAAYRILFAEKEQRWIKEVQPRAGENGNDAERGDEPGAHDHNEDEVAFGINLELEIVEQDLDIPPQQDNGAQQNNAAQQDNAAQQQPQNPAPPARQGNILMSTNRLAENIMGALCFPAIASAMGELIKVGLPKSWTSTPMHRRPSLLQTKWGRSIVGGCLFVVTKDMLLLYSRYRLAKDHRKRRVLDYDRSKGKTVRK